MDVPIPVSSKTNHPIRSKKDARLNAEYNLPLDMKPAASQLPIPCTTRL